MFNERLRDLMFENELEVKDLFKRLNIKNENIIYSWLNGKTYPNASNLVDLANIFECSTDYLLGRTDDYTQNTAQMKPFDKQLRMIMKIKHKSQFRMAQDNIAKPSTFHGWFVNKSLPTIESLIKLAGYFGVSVDFLVGRE